eukprot:393133-Prorocentrum_minimum.AAC.1
MYTGLVRLSSYILVGLSVDEREGRFVLEIMTVAGDANKDNLLTLDEINSLNQTNRQAEVADGRDQ